MKNSIFVCQNPVSSNWQLGSLPVFGASLTLIGWRLSTSIDGGLPEKIAGVLAQSMTAVSNVIFLSSDVKGDVPNKWQSIGEDAVCALKEPNPLKYFSNYLSGSTSDLVLLSTRKPEKAVNLFEDGIYSWWMQGQIALLSEPEQPIPTINRQILLSLFEEDWAKNALSLQNLGIQSVLRPGVDGSVAGFVFLTADFGNKF